MKFLLLLLLMSFVDDVSNEELLPKIEALPAPTAEIQQLVQDLGNDKFYIRENADKELRKLGRDAIAGLEEVADATKDLEIKLRAADILDTYYLTIPFEVGEEVRVLDRVNPRFRFDIKDGDFYYDTIKMPSIWSMSKNIRNVGDKDIAEEYFDKALKGYNQDRDITEQAALGTKHFRPVETYATYLFIEDMLHKGMEMAEAKYLLSQMRLRDYLLLSKPGL